MGTCGGFDGCPTEAGQGSGGTRLSVSRVGRNGDSGGCAILCQGECF